MTSPASDSLKEIVARLDQRIQTVDEERWLSSRYAPEEARQSLIILYAFYYELARVRVVVTDQTMGQIRFQWWRDALKELKQGAPRQHDVVLALESLFPRLEADDLNALIDQHELAFLKQNRALEPEDVLLGIAVRCLGQDPSLDQSFGEIAREWAALRRQDQVGDVQNWRKVASPWRPATAHFRLRHVWAGGRQPSALRMRLSILMAMLTGRV